MRSLAHIIRSNNELAKLNEQPPLPSLPEQRVVIDELELQEAQARWMDELQARAEARHDAENHEENRP